MKKNDRSEKKRNRERVISLSDEAIDVLRQARREFIEIFGRHPRRNDPVFPVRYLLSPKGLDLEIKKSMKAAGLDEDLIYVFERTGRMITKDGWAQLDAVERREVSNALKEFELLKKRHPDHKLLEDSLDAVLIKKLRDAQVILGYFAERYRVRRRIPESDFHFLLQFVSHSSARLIRSIVVLTEHDASFDCAALLRSFHELTLTIAYASANPGAAEVISGSLGVLRGTYQFDRNRRGEPRQDCLIRLHDGEKVAVPSRWQMASSLGPPFTVLYRSFYAYHCEISHNDVSIMRHLLTDNRGLSHLSPDRTLDVALEALLLIAIVSYYLRSFSACQAYLTRDLAALIRKCVFEIMTFRRWAVDNSFGDLSPAFMSIATHFFGPL